MKQGEVHSVPARVFSGRKGFGKGSSTLNRSPIEQPNTLQSVATARVVDMLCEGPIGGLVDGLKSVYFDDTPVQNADGSYNFTGVVIQTRNGLPDQSVIPGYSQIESEVGVGIQATVPLSVTQRITNSDVDAVRIKVRIPALLQQITDVTASNYGDVVETSVSFRLQCSTNGGPYVDFAGSPYTISGKTTSPYERQYEFALPAGGPPWDIRLVRVTADSTLSSLQNQTFFGTLTEITYAKVAYADSAVVGIQVDTRQLDHVPSRGYEIVPLLMRIPSNYDPETHVYDPDIWDGTFKTDATENPAWIIYEFITNNRFGLGQDIPPEFLDKFMMYDIGRYCDERVPNGSTPLRPQYIHSLAFDPGPPYSFSIYVPNHGVKAGDFVIIKNCTKEECNGTHQVWYVDAIGLYFADVAMAAFYDNNPDLVVYKTEPRFTCNANFNTSQTAYALISSLCSCMRAQPFWSSGGIAFAQDAPADTSKIVSRSNTIDGDFNYSSPEFKDRYTVARVTWSDPSDGYKVAVEYVEEPTMIARFGPRPVDVFAVGATTRSQARRQGLWMLLVNRYCSQVVQYKCGLDQASLCPGEIVELNDPAQAGVRNAGRIAALDASSGASVVTLDAGIEILASEDSTLSVVMSDGTVQTRSVVNDPGPDQTVITVSPAFSATDILVGAQWGFSSSSVMLRKFRVVGAKEFKPHQFEITAVAHEPDIYDAIDFGASVEPTDFSILPSGALVGPGGMTVMEYLYTPDGGITVVPRAIFSWTPSSDARITMYEMQVIRPGLTAFAAYDDADGVTQNIHAILDNAVDGLYLVRMRGRDNFGRSSPWGPSSGEGQDFQEFYLSGLAAPPADVQNFRSVISVQRLTLQWDKVLDLDMKNYVIKYSPALSGATWAGSQTLFDDIDKGRTAIDVALISGTYMIKARDTSLVESRNETLIVVDSIGSISLNLVETIQEDPDWLGTHDGTVAYADKLQLSGDSGSFMADWPSLADVIAMMTGSGSFEPEGTYYFFSQVDLGARFDVRVTTQILADAVNIYNVIVAWDSLADIPNLAGYVESEVGVDLLISQSDDMTLWTLYQAHVGADLRCRGLRFALRLTTTKPFITPRVSSAIITVDMYDRDVQGADIVATGGVKTVTFVPPFKSARPPTVVSVQDMQSGDYWAFTSQPDEDGFAIEIRNSTGDLVERTFDYFSRGWGAVLS